MRNERAFAYCLLRPDEKAMINDFVFFCFFFIRIHVLWTAAGAVEVAFVRRAAKSDAFGGHFPAKPHFYFIFRHVFLWDYKKKRHFPVDRMGFRLYILRWMIGVNVCSFNLVHNVIR